MVLVILLGKFFLIGDSMKITLGCDHAAFEEKELLKAYLQELGHEVDDLGPYSGDRVNYPDFASKVAKVVASGGGGKGIILCGSGIGVSMVANRYARVRAALVRSEEEAKLSRQHNDANVLCMGARLINIETIKKLSKIWLETEFEGGRHSERIALFNELGEK